MDSGGLCRPAAKIIETIRVTPNPLTDERSEPLLQLGICIVAARSIHLTGSKALRNLIEGGSDCIMNLSGSHCSHRESLFRGPPITPAAARPSLPSSPLPARVSPPSAEEAHRRSASSSCTTTLRLFRPAATTFLPRFFGAASSSALFFLFGHSRKIPDLSVFSTRYGLPHSGHFFATGFRFDVKSHFG